MLKLHFRGLGFLVLIFSLTRAQAADRDPMARLFGPGGTSVDYTFHHSPGSSSGDGSVSPVINTERVRASFLLVDNGTDTWSLQQSASQFNLTESPVIPERNVKVPDSLWDIATGVSYGHRIDDRRRWGASASVGSASDKPYDSLHETAATATAFYMFPARRKNAWIVLLNYSNHRTFLNNIPIPGFAYAYKSDDEKLQAMLGFPFASLNYKVSSDANARFYIFGPRTIGTEFSQRVGGPVRAYAGFDWGQQEWMRANRDDDKNRIFYDTKKLALGIRSPIGGGFSIDLSGGREFDRRFFENRSSSSKDVPYASLANDWFIETQLSWRLFNPNKHTPKP
jgi:hypothetical protein